MRVNPTVTWVTREALEDVDLHDLHVPKGGIVQVMSHSAGTDPQAMPDPSFDITQQRPPHLGFGAGIHHCLGHFVARTDMAVALPCSPGGCPAPCRTARASGCPCRATPGGDLPDPFQAVVVHVAPPPVLPGSADCMTGWWSRGSAGSRAGGVRSRSRRRCRTQAAAQRHPAGALVQAGLARGRGLLVDDGVPLEVSTLLADGPAPPRVRRGLVPLPARRCRASTPRRRG